MAAVIALQSKPSPCTDSAVPLGDMKASASQGPKKMPVLYPEQVSPYQDDIYKSRTFVPTVPVLQYWKSSRMRDKYILSWFQEPIFYPCRTLKLKIFADSQYTVSLRIWQLDMTQSFSEPAMIATKQRKKDTSLLSPNSTQKTNKRFNSDIMQGSQMWQGDINKVQHKFRWTST